MFDFCLGEGRGEEEGMTWDIRIIVDLFGLG